VADRTERQMNPSGRFDALVDMGNPLKGIVVFPFLSRYKEGRALRAMGPAVLLEMSRTVGELGTAWRWVQREFAIGYGDKEYEGWRRMTKAQWQDVAWQAQLVDTHEQRGGWPLLEEPLECEYMLRLAEGYAMISGAYVVEVGWNGYAAQQLRGRYPAMKFDFHEKAWTTMAWTTMAPMVGNNWNVEEALQYFRFPCLFVKN
jgi:hypothetical protein